MKFTMTNDTITLMHNGDTHLIRKDMPYFKAVRTAVLDENWDEVAKYITPTDALLQWLGNGWELKEGSLHFKKEPIEKALSERIIKMAQNGANPTNWQKFWVRLQANPSWRSVQQLYTFLTHENIPITSEGCFLAYKAVRRDWKDFHSNTFDNRPGQVLEMPRNRISDDPKLACHEGFHVGALGYVSSFGGGDRRIVICEVDPADVVCVPYDAQAQKVRVCKYKVVGNYSGEPLPSDSDPLEDEDNEEEDFEDLDEEDLEDLDEEDLEDLDEEEEGILPEEGEIVLPEVKVDLASLDMKSHFELSNLSLSVLRSYAAKHLKIVGASKIPGGKPALLERIREVRTK